MPYSGVRENPSSLVRLAVRFALYALRQKAYGDMGLGIVRALELYLMVV